MKPPVSRHRLVSCAEHVGPVWTAFALSILLSLIALSAAITPNDDGMLYVETARAFQSEGLSAALQLFDWPFLPILMAAVSSFTGLEVEASGYLLSTVFIAGTCSLIVACTREMLPRSGWAAMVVVLTVPALNNYRDHIIREFGAWFLLFLALWLLLRWARRPGWAGGLAAQSAICAAALFRLETLIFLAVPVLWQLIAIRHGGGWRRVAMFLLPPLLGGVGVGLLAGVGDAEFGSRVAQQLNAIDLAPKHDRFFAMAAEIGSQIDNKYAIKQMPTILFFGAFGLLLSKFISNFGLLIVPGIYALIRPRLPVLLVSAAPFAIAFAVYAIVPLAFVLDSMFLSSRYVALLNLLAVPLVSVGLAHLFQRIARWRIPLIAIAVMMGLSNVISTTPPETRMMDAATWLKLHGADPSRVFVEPREVIYLVGWPYHGPQAQSIRGREEALVALASGAIDLALLDLPSDSPDLQHWAKEKGLRSVERFADARNRTVHAFVRSAAPALDHR